MPDRGPIDNLLTRGLEQLRDEPLPLFPHAGPEAVWANVSGRLERPAERRSGRLRTLCLAGALTLTVALAARTVYLDRAPSERAAEVGWVARAHTSEPWVDDPGGAGTERVFSSLRAATEETP